MTEPGVIDAGAWFGAFAERRIPWVVDDIAVRALAAGHGYRAIDVDAYDLSAPPASPVLFVPRRFATHDALVEAWGETPAVVTHYSLARYDTPPAYAIERLLAVDFAATLARRRALWAALDDAARVELHTAAGVLTAWFGEAVEAANPGDVLEPGGNPSIGEFFEAAIVNIEAPTSSFRAEGRLAFDAIGWLCNDDALADATRALRDEWVARAARGANVATFEGGRLVELRLGGADATDALHALCAGKERETAANELGFGARGADPAIDRAVNALIHKSGPGAYLGFGAGHLIPHVDLIAADARVAWRGADG
ncbi:MAG: hypothetical protein H6701_10615 [Myxococcales bacterium]|nr:hypothetical protein [Myxococcales bacterium]MCB9553273.1 hypothetical protein [Myxococcales bacterium]